MSWSFYMGVPIAADGGLVILNGYNDLGYTYNVAPMYFRAFEGFVKGVRGLDGLTGAEALPYLDSAIQRMKDNPLEYRAMNPPNGWGDYEGALEVLEKLSSWARELPTAVIMVR